ncbi:MAG: TPM domain-containing protein [Acidobacteriota bacterium]
MVIPRRRSHVVAALLVLAVVTLANGVAAEVTLPRIRQPIEDFAQRLSPAVEIQLTERLHAHREQTGVQAAVVLTPDLSGLPIEDYALALAEAWAGGEEGEDRGLVVLLDFSSRRARIEVGYGLEGHLPDVTLRRLLDEVAPDLRNGRFDQAVTRLVDRLIERTADIQPDRPVRQLLPPLGARQPVVYLVVIVLGAFAGEVRRRFFPGLLSALATWLVLPLLLAFVFRDGPGFFFALPVCYLAATLLPMLAERAGRPYLVMSGTFAVLFFLAPCLPLLLGRSIVVSNGVDLLTQAAIHWAGALVLAFLLPWASRHPYFVLRIVEMILSGGVTYGRHGRSSGSPRPWSGGGGRYGGGGASGGW